MCVCMCVGSAVCACVLSVVFVCVYVGSAVCVDGEGITGGKQILTQLPT